MPEYRDSGPRHPPPKESLPDGLLIYCPCDFVSFYFWACPFLEVRNPFRGQGHDVVEGKQQILILIKF